MKTTFRSLLEKHEKFIGSYITFPADTAIEVMKQAGVDFVILDLEHEQLTMTEVMSMIRTCDACGMAAMVRVPGLDETSIRKALDMGASAIKVPGITNAAEAKLAVALCKYPPEGVRGACPFTRNNGYGVDRAGCYAKANREVAVSVIIEGVEGVRNMEEIIATPGIDTVSIGNIDLAVALGVPGQVFHPKVKQAVLDCAALCEQYGKSCSAQVLQPSDAAEFAKCKGISHYHTDFPQYLLYKAYKDLCEGLKSYSVKG
ncbi:MAG: aldolase/citrate lyase family protein [Acidaminococcus provencensis]|jgi:2-keto-3-deoxy-L-rhamnonate aldolase RhmA|uniref:HpcH/HpaI aldolase family protein n=1 Tax=Acidaminococcus TaxID=904 RepID=UPI000CF9B247|nr:MULTISPECIES: aldolase/citrate lyase family protein [Acidaminococcus]MCH4096162.1 aldolase/citrate lyase family protein [Acidaminococcus provencensis]RHK01365.1 siderophore biosynthesis protein SbnG [Acidaminococcus sp. AM05-11]